MSSTGENRMLWQVKRHRGGRVRYQNAETGKWGPWISYADAGACVWICDAWHRRAVLQARYKSLGNVHARIVPQIEDVTRTMRSLVKSLSDARMGAL